ncbi:MAG: hypothetical protein LWW94_09000 [Candidatus Desulfofervidaceae bacterium]|nr:hypothetical protein [Candidatus Desulfofervidaceae bacterium]
MAILEKEEKKEKRNRRKTSKVTFGSTRNRINYWHREQFLREFNNRERKYFLELAQKSILEGYPVCLDLYFFCFFSTIKFRFLTQAGHDARFSYVYAWGLKDLNDQISFYKKRLDKLKNP